MKYAGSIFSLALVVALGACSQGGPPSLVTPELGLSQMQQPRVEAGETWRGFKSGSQRTKSAYFERIVRVDGSTADYLNGEGCQFTRYPWSFAPALAWRNCPPHSDGFQRITAVEGELWPLQVGKRVSYVWNGYDMSGQSWSGRRTCAVTDERSVRTVSGTHEAYKISCDDPWTQATWYVSPELREVVLRKVYDKDLQRLTTWELRVAKRPGRLADPR